MANVRANRPPRNRKKTSRLRAKKKLRVIRRKNKSPHGRRAGIIR
ncbi:MAG: hypothetical protein NTX25_02055 [Proteobacteria bacterium]|nr:hypothetical protein [Pseudomonadota bacterium]